MRTYTLSSQASSQSRKLGLKLATPERKELSSVFDKPADSPAEIARVAKEGVAEVVADMKSQGLDPKDTQFIVEVSPRMQSAVEDALRKEGVKPVYQETGKDSFGVESDFLRPSQNLKPAARSATDSSRVTEVVDLGSGSKELAAAEKTLRDLPQSASSQDIKDAVSSYVSAVEQEFDKHGAREGGRAAVMSESLPSSLSTLVESRLQDKGVTPLFRADAPEQGTPGLQVSELRESANEFFATLEKGKEAVNKSLKREDAEFSDAAIEKTFGVKQLQELGSMDPKARSVQAGELVAQNLDALKSAQLDEITAADNKKYSSDSYKDKYEFPSGVPKDAMVYFWVGSKSNAVFGFGGTSADMARGMDRVQDFMDAKGFAVTKDEIRDTFDKKTLEKMGREGFDASKFEATYSALTAAANATGGDKPTPLDALHTQQRMENSGLSDDVKVMSDGKTLTTLGDVREQVRESMQQLTNESSERGEPGRESLENSRETPAEAGASAWDKAFGQRDAAGEPGERSEQGRDEASRDESATRQEAANEGKERDRDDQQKEREMEREMGMGGE